MEFKAGFCPQGLSSSGLHGSLCLGVTSVRERGPQSACLSITGHADTTNQVRHREVPDRGVDKISESLGDPGSELSGSEKAAVAIKLGGRRTLGWRLNNRAGTRSNRTLKLHPPGRRPGPGSGEDSPEGRTLPSLPQLLASPAACSSAGGNFSYSPSSPSTTRTSPPQISPPRPLGVLRTGSEPLNCFACHPVTVATPSGGARRSNRSLRPLSSLSQGGDRDAARDGEGAGQNPVSGTAQATQSPGRQSSSSEVGWQA